MNYSIVADDSAENEKRIEAGISLKGNLLLYESYARPLAGFLSQFYEADLEYREREIKKLSFH